MLHINTSHACVVPITIPEQRDQEKAKNICGKTLEVLDQF